MAFERLRQEAEQPSTSASTDTDRSGKKKGAPYQPCVSSDIKTSYDRKITCASHLGQFDQEDKSRKDDSRIMGGLSIYKEYK
ncbi:hypothetical protein T07_1248 [Trichinella nelsoni]|uniref:Uncharacterized protein n=1 Tax=Trichinella nelsoni TaxID=6336 RepID=A0A0V0RP28_9BILA|nr:hypothetical protein T07_1248 [Trichinella nelsoni]